MGRGAVGWFSGQLPILRVLLFHLDNEGEQMFEEYGMLGNEYS